MIIPASAPKTPPPNPEELPHGTLIVTRHNPKVPVHVMEVVPFPGALAGYLVRHDGIGVPALDGADIRLWKGPK